MLKQIFYPLSFILFPVIVFSQPVDPVFTHFRGMEDTLGTTHLFYKKELDYGYNYYNNLYHLNVTNMIDTIFLAEYFQPDPFGMYDQGAFISDYEFWHNDPSAYIYCGCWISMDPTAHISRFDTVNVFTWIGSLDNVEISHQNDNLVYASLYTILLKSFDAGITWPSDTLFPPPTYSMLAISPFNDQVVFSYDEPYYSTQCLYRSRDGGVSYVFVDSSFAWGYSTRLLFDRDSVHIYACTSYNHHSMFSISADSGNTWQLIFDDPAHDAAITIDDSISGLIYLSKDNEIFVSTDYATSFTFYANLDRTAIGLYKKSKSDLLYACTRKDIFEISPQDITSIKSLPMSGIEQEAPLTQNFELYQNYPNPFNNETIISYYIPRSDKIDISIYNIQGQKICQLYQGTQSSGNHELLWDGRNNYGQESASGIYFFQLKSGSFIIARKMVIIR
jgi:FlgD Ig-like domain